MPPLIESLRLEAEECLREADQTDDPDAKADLLFRAARLHSKALQLENRESEPSIV